MQETWASRPGPGGIARPSAELQLWLNQAADAAHLPRYQVFWGDNTADLAHNSGVAILVRPGPGLTVSSPSHTPCGRAMAVQLEWGGHRFWAVNTYWPSASAAARAGVACPRLLHGDDVQVRGCPSGDEGRDGEACDEA